MPKELIEIWFCDDCKKEWYMLAEDVFGRTLIGCPFCLTYGSHIYKTGARYVSVR